MKYYLRAWTNYAKFNGRATRSEYWYFFLFHIIVVVILTLAELYLQITYLGTIYSIAVLIPSLALAVRRVHDTNKNGWYVIIPIYNLVLMCTAGTYGDNDYGPDPNKPEYDQFLTGVDGTASV
jgi:uncharacterized membrane protein YhaH (DUF805 family)